MGKKNDEILFLSKHKKVLMVYLKDLLKILINSAQRYDACSCFFKTETRRTEAEVFIEYVRVNELIRVLDRRGQGISKGGGARF